MNICAYILIANCLIDFGFIIGKWGQKRDGRFGWSSVIVDFIILFLLLKAFGIF